MSLNLDQINRKIFLLKIYAFFAYGTSVFYFLFALIWFYLNGISVAEIFAYNIFVVVIMLIFNNLSSRLSDKIKKRAFFMIMVKILSILAVIVIILDVSLMSLMIFAFLLYFISNETFLTAYFYELLEARERIKSEVNSNFRENKSKEFTKFRIMGSIGWAIGGPIAGFIIEAGNNITNSSLKGFQIAFFISIVMNLINICYLYTITRCVESKLKIGKGISKEMNQQQKNKVKNKRSLFRNYEFLFLLSITFVLEISLSLSASIKTIYATELGGTYLFVGLLAFVWAMCEVPLFFISASLVEKFSYKVPILISAVFLIVKYLFYIYIVTPETLLLFLLLEALNTFGILWPAITYAINNIAKEKKAFGTSIYLTLMALARFIGYIIGMVLAITYNIGGNYENYKILFVWALFLAFMGVVIFLIFNLLILKAKYKNKKLIR